MCGLGGCVLAAGRPVAEAERARLARLGHAIAHRGPDGSGTEITGSVGLVHSRLAIVDPSERAAQPLRLGPWTLAYNGEIYNHQELRRGLPEARFRSSGDTETLLHGLACRGSRIIPELAGMFAFAAYDRDRGRLLLARDPFGVKPLYLARDRDGSIWFASEIRALLAAGIAPRVHPARLAAYIDRPWAPGHGNLLEGIEPVAAGGTTEVDIATLELTRSRYFSLEQLVDPALQEDLAARTRRELVDRVDAALEEAVASSLLADVPIGGMISGGLDSTVVTALAMRRHPGLIAFGATVPSEGLVAEGRAARRAARPLGVELQLVEVTPDSWRAGLVAATRYYDGPLHSPGAVAIAEIALRARNAGVKALLTGEGADEIFGGYRALHRSAYDAFQPHWVRLLQRAHQVRRPDPRRLLARVAGARSRRERSAPPALHHGGTLEAMDSGSFDGGAYPHHHGLRGELENRILEALPGSLEPLLQRMDRTNMQRSVEARVPFLERPLARIAVNLPLEARSAPFTKGVLRDVAARHMPRRIAYWPKVPGFQFDARSWIGERAEPAFLADGLLREQLAIARGRWQEICADPGYSRAVRLWSAEIWCRQTLERADDAAIEAALWR